MHAAAWYVCVCVYNEVCIPFCNACMHTGTSFLFRLERRYCIIALACSDSITSLCIPQKNTEHKYTLTEPSWEVEVYVPPIILLATFTHFIQQTYSHKHLTLLYTGYIGEFEIIDDHRANKIVIELTGRLNKCGVISPRFDVPYDEIEKWIVNLLPSRQFGHLILSTTYGIMTHEEARRKKTGGKILGFFY